MTIAPEVKGRLFHYGEALIVGVCVFSLWSHFKPAPATVGEYIVPKTSPAVLLVPTVTLTPPKVIALAPVAKNKLNLPPEIQNDPNKYVLGTAKLPADTHPSTIVPVFDVSTGKTEINVRRDPLPWLAAESAGYVSVGYGIKSGVGKVFRLGAGYDVLQVKALHMGVDSTMDGDGKGYVGAHIEYRL
jgi:hypothetical protein